MLRRSVRILCPTTGNVAGSVSSETQPSKEPSRPSGAEVAASFLGTLKNRRVVTEPDLQPDEPAIKMPQSSPASSPSPTSDGRAPSTQEISQERLHALFANRRSPKNLYSQGMHSDTLSDHPVTMKQARDELAYKQRKLVERGQYEKAVDVEEQLESNDSAGKSGAEANEYKWVIFFLMLGYVTAHFTVFNYYYPEDMRLPYDPKKGYIEDIQRKEDSLQKLDSLVQSKVMEYTFNTKRAAAKDKADKYYQSLQK